MGASNEDFFGIEVVYFGGIDTDLDLALFEALGRDSNDSGCGLRTGRRDLFWRCPDYESALLLRGKLAQDIKLHPDFQKSCADHKLTFALMTEDRHWADKLGAIPEDPRPPEGVKQKRKTRKGEH